MRKRREHEHGHDARDHDPGVYNAVEFVMPGASALPHAYWDRIHDVMHKDGFADRLISDDDTDGNYDDDGMLELSRFPDVSAEIQRRLSTVFVLDEPHQKYILRPPSAEQFLRAVEYIAWFAAQHYNWPHDDTHFESERLTIAMFGLGVGRDVATYAARLDCDVEKMDAAVARESDLNNSVHRAMQSIGLRRISKPPSRDPKSRRGKKTNKKSSFGCGCLTIIIIVAAITVVASL